MGPKRCKTKHMAKSGRDPFAPGMGPGRGSDPGEGLDGTPRDSNRRLGLSDFVPLLPDFGTVVPFFVHFPNESALASTFASTPVSTPFVPAPLPALFRF